MSVLEVLKFPDERLRTVAQPVAEITTEIETNIEDLIETMYDAKGVGLAATQVDIHKRIFVADCSEEYNEPLVFVNPEITEKRGVEVHEEGCLSFPTIYAKVERAESVTVKALDKEGNEFTMDADGLLAICIQHELDHLNGKLFVDYLSPLKRQRIKAKLEKEAKLATRTR
ncbi:peptide deformylase [Catenovulum sp. SM1970]|uniref:peptide deformylase n=1 Tax=Marinifaba aquimaris TaxID=2741323 RepID=UPI00157248A9|nr:peptide deformylase [Marinifaba aquimaris]NTS78654.1 peptide deformylase [Marinifaba aquimaris]